MKITIILLVFVMILAIGIGGFFIAQHVRESKQRKLELDKIIKGTKESVGNYQQRWQQQFEKDLQQQRRRLGIY